MPDYRYLIIGGGMSAAAALRGIRSADPTGAIGVIGAETDPPYKRPAVSKGLWKGAPLKKIWLKHPDAGVTLHLGRRALQLEPSTHRVTDDEGTAYGYDKLLLATGGTPKRLPFGEDVINYVHTLEDYRRLRALVDKHRRFVVIGGGFIGSEIAAALTMNGAAVTMLFPEDAIGARQFPTDLAHSLNDYYREQGVEVVPAATVTAVQRQGDQVTVLSGDGRQITADGVVAGIGIAPNVQLAESAGLTLDNGICVDASLCTSVPDIYAAGDVAAFHNPTLGMRIRVEHEDNANAMGELAGRAMAGEPVDYDYLPYFYSDLFELGYEAVGELDARLATVGDWQETHRKGVVYYLRDKRVRGILLWNVWGQVDAARALINDRGPFDAGDLKGRISG